MPPTLRISVVATPDALVRRQRALGGLRGVSLADAAHHGAIGTLHPEAADLVVVAVHTDGFDRCGGLLDVAGLAATFGAHRVVLLADEEVDAVVRLRAHHAGAHHLLRSDELTGDALRSIAVRRSPRPDLRHLRRELAALGLTPASQPGAALAYVAQHRLEDAFSAPPSIEASGLSRRRTITIRQHLTAAVGIESDDQGSGAVVKRTLPSWRQVHAVVTAARGA